MRIRLVHVVFALIIASILNLAIAWLCAYYTWPGYRGSILLFADDFDRDSGLITERDHDLSVLLWTAFGITEFDCLGPWYNLGMNREKSPASGLGDQFDSFINNFPDRDPLFQNRLRHEFLKVAFKKHTRIDAGWPMRSFRGFVSGGIVEIDPIDIEYTTSWPPYKRLPLEETSAITTERSFDKGTLRRYLPYMPIWFGLIVNTLLYSTVIIAIIWLPIALRSNMRLRRKLCPNCKYPIGVSEVCTECGSPLPVSN